MAVQDSPVEVDIRLGLFLQAKNIGYIHDNYINKNNKRNIGDFKLQQAKFVLSSNVADNKNKLAGTDCFSDLKILVQHIK